MDYNAVAMLSEMSLVEHVLEQAVQRWRDWEGAVPTVDVIADYLNHYHVRHYTVPILTEVAYTSFMLIVENKIRDDHNAADLPPRRLLVHNSRLRQHSLGRMVAHCCWKHCMLEKGSTLMWKTHDRCYFVNV